MSNENVVFLAFSNPSLELGHRDLLACVTCRNKTFTVVFNGHDEFPMMQCPACGSHVGRIGWAPKDEVSK